MQIAGSSRFYGMVLRVLVLSLTVLATFALTVVVVLLPLRLFFQIPLEDRDGLFLGIVCGLVVWLFLAIFHIKSETVRLTFDDRAVFQKLLHEHLDEMGYEVPEQTPDRLVLRPSFKSFLLGGRIEVDFQETTARVTGPKMFVEILRNRLRLKTHMAQVHKTLSSGNIHLDRVHRRVQIGLRIVGHQWRGVDKEILENLARAGADVICDVDILAKSDNGIHDLVLEQHIRNWLKREHICARIITDPSQWDESRWRGAPLGLDNTEINVKVEERTEIGSTV